MRVPSRPASPRARARTLKTELQRVFLATSSMPVNCYLYAL